MKISDTLKPVYLLVTAIMALVFVSGCAFEGFNTQAKPQTAPAETPAPEKVKKPTAVYYDFEDVIVPMELSIVKDRTVIVATPGFKSGILTLKGRVDSTALFNFFSNNMEKDNWEVVSKIKSPGTTIMVFQKTARCAVITIRDESLYTYVEIGVAPTLSSGQGVGKTGGLTY